MSESSRIANTFYKAGEWASSNSTIDNEADPAKTRRKGAATIGALGVVGVGSLIAGAPALGHRLEVAWNQMTNEVQTDQSPMDAVGEAVHNNTANIAVQQAGELPEDQFVSVSLR